MAHKTIVIEYLKKCGRIQTNATKDGLCRSDFHHRYTTRFASVRECVSNMVYLYPVSRRMLIVLL